MEELDKIRNYLKVEKDGKVRCYLNPALALKQKMTPAELVALASLHNQLQDLFEEIEECEDASLYPSYAKKVEELEYQMQEAWKFERDATKHSWWFRTPHCKCPILDNMDNLGTPQRVISKQCPVHGNLLVES